jgi:hypothetical protein
MNKTALKRNESKCSWHNLLNVFTNDELRDIFEDLESRYHVEDEADFFAHLVNMSTANNEAFHRWIRYREGYAGELVKEILRRHPVDPAKHFVMDPMCGSGSSLVACGEIGIDAIGLDVNGYAVLATNVKSHRYRATELKQISGAISKVTTIELVHKDDIEDHLVGISKYFPMKNLNWLCSIQHWINDQFKTKGVKDFFNVALLAILEDCSDRKKDGNGLATRPAPVSDVLSRFRSQLEMMLEDISHSSSPHGSLRQGFDCSALQLSKATKTFSTTTKKQLGAVIFSPPYANSFDYFESYKLELVFGGFVHSSDLKESRQRLIRNYRITAPKNLVHRIRSVELLCDEIVRKIPEKEAETGVRDGRTRLVPNMLRGYFEDMKSVIQEGYDSLGIGGTMHIVVDQSAYVGVPIPTDLIFGLLAEELGFEVIAITNCRKANTSGQQLKKFPYLKSLLRESIVSLKKA